jgi:transcription elongation GreA/GreB family factor
MRTAFGRRQTKTGSVDFTKVFATVRKATLRDAILQQLRQELQRQTSAAELARDEATSEESRAENKWDTHSQEAAYLAEGQAKLASEVSASIALIGTMALPDFAAGDPIALGALVEVQSTKTQRHFHYFLVPRAGGMELVVDSHEVLVLTPQSPLGRQLIGRRVGDTVPAPGGPGAGMLRIVDVA